MNNNYERLLSIILITKNRFEYINRLLAYYDFIKLKSPILIADSTEFQKLNLDFNYYKIYKNLNISFYFRPNTKPENLQLEMLEKITTKYTILCADDDIILRNSIYKCVKFLEKNNDYIAATGKIFGFTTENDKAKKCRVNFMGEYKQNTISANDGHFRLKNYLSKYWVNIFSIIRTECFTKTSQLSQCSTSSAMKGEIIPCAGFALLGKTKKLEHIHMLRQFFLKTKHYHLKSVLEHSLVTSLWSQENEKLKKGFYSLLLNQNKKISFSKFSQYYNVSIYHFIKNEILLYQVRFIFDYLFGKIFRKGKIKAIINIFIKIYKKIRIKFSKVEGNDNKSLFNCDAYKELQNYLGFLTK